jgi:hypothetical protein
MSWQQSKAYVHSLCDHAQADARMCLTFYCCALPQHRHMWRGTGRQAHT